MRRQIEMVGNRLVVLCTRISHMNVLNAGRRTRESARAGEPMLIGQYCLVLLALKAR